MFLARSFIRRRSFAGFVAVVAVSALAACSAAGDSQPSGPAAAAQDGGTAVIAQSADAQPNSFLSTAIGNVISQYAVFETLTLLDTKTRQPRGVLAESWTLSPDNLSMDIKLRDDVTFHTGRKMTSADVVFTIRTVQDPATAANTRFIASEIATVEAKGDYEVRLTFKRALPNIFDLFEVMPIVDKDTYSGYAAGKNVDGTGRFVWKSWTPGGKVILEKYPNYRDAKGTRLDRIEIDIISDPTAQLAAIRSGRVHYAFGLPALDSRTLSADKRFALVQSGGAVIPLAFDVTKAPFTSKAVRQAAHYAIDRDRIIAQVEGGQGTATSIPWRTNMPGYDAAQAKQYTYQPDRAKQMIADAGATGASFPVLVPNFPEVVAIFQIVKNNLAAVGLNAEAKIVSGSEYDEKLSKRDMGTPAFMMLNSNAFSPPSAVLSRPELNGTNNVSHLSTPEYARLTQAVATAPTPDALTQAMRPYNTYFLDEAFVLPLIFRSTLSVRSTSFDGLAPTALGFINVGTAFLVK